MIGVSAQSVSKWETGTNMPDVMLFPLLAGIFEVSIDELFGIPSESAVRLVPINSVVDEAFDAILHMMSRAWPSERDKISEAELTEDTRATKEYLINHPNSQSIIFTDSDGAVYVDKNLGLVFKKDTS